MVGKELGLRKFVAPEFVFGVGARMLAGRYARNLGARRVLLVSDPLVRAAGWTDDVAGVLAEAGVEVEPFDDVSPNPRDHEVMAGAARFQEASCNAVVVVGGGSPMDCAKGIGIVAANGGDILDFEGVDRIGAPCPPLICVPTTAGTAADISQFCIVNDTARRVKIAIISKAVVPDVALVDPQTTTTMDRELTAATGMDALCHAFEALASNASSPITDVHALEAAALVFAHLRGALADPAGVEHRTGMMLGSLQAGLAFSNASLGAVHAMAHALGGRLDLPHGLCNAILLPHVVRFNSTCASAAYARMGRRLGLSTAGAPPDEIVDALIDALVSLQRDVGANTPLGSLGVSPSDVPVLAAFAIQDACIVTNPVEPSRADIEGLFARAL